MIQDRLDVLASAEAVDAEVHAFAGELTAADLPNLGGIFYAAGRVNVEIGINREARLAVDDLR